MQSPPGNVSNLPFDPIDWPYVDALNARHVADIADGYFRSELIGIENVPDDGPAIIAPNHSGNALPYDAIMLDYLLWRKAGFSRQSKCRSVFAADWAIALR